MDQWCTQAIALFRIRELATALKNLAFIVQGQPPKLAVVTLNGNRKGENP